MQFSEYLAAAKDAVNHVKANVRYRGLNTGGGWIRKPLDVPQKFAARIDLMQQDSRNRADWANRTASWDDHIDEWARQAKSAQTGNCCELSAIAFRYLQSKRIAPVEYFAVYRGTWNHAFVVLNRDQSIPVADFAKWSQYAVACDPLYDRAADAGHLATWYSRMFPLRAIDLRVTSK